MVALRKDAMGLIHHGRDNLAKMKTTNEELWKQITKTQEQLRDTTAKCQDLLAQKASENKRIAETQRKQVVILRQLREKNLDLTTVNAALETEIAKLRYDNEMIVKALMEYFLLIQKMDIDSPEGLAKFKEQIGWLRKKAEE